MQEKILNLLFPPRCEMCNALGKYICNNCYEQLKKYQLQNNSKEKFFLYKYEEQIRKMLINYKFNGKGYLCNLFSQCILNNKTACEFIKQYELVIPVPLHRKRKNERGYNQSELIAKKVLEELKYEEIQDNYRAVTLNTRILKKIKKTKPQSMQNLENRKKSVNGIYTVKNANEIKGRKVLIFDDIYTTGSTYNECKKVLLSAGAKNVGVFTVAKDFLK